MFDHVEGCSKSFDLSVAQGLSLPLSVHMGHREREDRGS